MKKILLIATCLLLVLSGCSFAGGGKVEFISIDGFETKMKEKETFILLITKDSCPHCEDLKEMLDDTINKHTAIIYNLKLDESSDENYNQNVEQLSAYFDKPGRTPHTYFIDQGEVKDDLLGFRKDQADDFWKWVDGLGLKDMK